MKPAFLTRPLDWTRAARGSADPVAYACAVTHNVKRAPWRIGDLIRAVALVVACVLIGLMLAGKRF